VNFKIFAKKIIFICGIVLALFIIFIAAKQLFTHKLNILFTHDLHSNLDEYFMPAPDGGAVLTGGYARLAKAIANERKGKEKDTLVLDGGDFSMGTLFHTIRSKYSPELITMGLMGYDATTLGNHEFDFGPGQLGAALLSAKKYGHKTLPAIIASNTIVDHDPGDFSRALIEYPVIPYMVIRRAGLKIGIFGLMGKEAAIYAPEAKPVIFSDPLEAARRSVDILRNKEKVDMVICLSHSGTWADKSISEDEILAKEAPGIDVIISGHTHSVLAGYIRVGNTYIVSSGCYSRNLGQLVVAKNLNGSFRALGYKIIPINSNIPEDLKIANRIKLFAKIVDKKYLGQFNYHYGEVLAESGFSLPDPDWDQCDDRARCLSSGLGDLVGDAFRYAVKKAEGKNYRDISLAFENFGQIRVPLAKGKITVNDAFRLLALGIGPDNLAGSGLVVFWLTGNEIKKMLELEATFGPVKHDMRLQVTGARFSYDTKRAAFSRVKKVEIQESNGEWQAMEDNRLYRVCTNWKAFAMRQNLEELSGGKISFIPKDRSGKVISDLKKAIIYINTNKLTELKEWLAFILYLESFPDTNADGLADLPREYLGPKSNITQEN